MDKLILAIYEAASKGSMSESTRDELLCIVEKLSDEQRNMKKKYKEKELNNENKKYGGYQVNASRKTIETLDKSHRYLAKLAKNRDDESDKKIALAYKTIKNITKSPEGSNIEYTTIKDYTGKKYPEDEDYKKDKDGYYYFLSRYPHSKKDEKGKPITSNDKKLIHLTNANYEGDPRPSQYSFGHSKNKEYEKTTRLHPKKRIYGFPESDDQISKYPSYGDKKKVINTNGKKIYKNSESDEGGFIEY